MMTKNRLEAFSDGVFAIVITLLILNVRLPDGDHLTNGQLYAGLLKILPNVLTFLFTFLIVGVFWVAHHRIFSFLHAVTPTLLWINILYLMFIVLIPFPAAILAKHPLLQVSILLYCCTLLLVGLFHFIFIKYIYKHPELRDPDLPKDLFRRALQITALGPTCYLIAVIVSFFNVYISFGFILVPFVFFVVVTGILRPISKRGHKRLPASTHQ